MRLGFYSLFVTLTVCFVQCQQQKSDKQGEDTATEISANQKLYDEVMRIHDEVMPKMNDLYKAKTSMKTRMEMPGLPKNERQEIQRNIARLDSASEGMMVWMRQFNPPPDSAGEEKARAYLESELEKIKKVREDILDALKTSASGE
jgi:hypothetical protein